MMRPTHLLSWPSVAIVVSTRDRRDITAIALSFLSECRRSLGGEVIVLDDHSTQYDAGWLEQEFNVDRVVDFNVDLARIATTTDPDERKPFGAGKMARLRLKVGIETHAEYIITLDNDALVTRGFDTMLMKTYDAILRANADLYVKHLLLTAYRSRWPHLAVESGSRTAKAVWGDWDQMVTIGGINHCVNRETAQFLIDTIPEEKWDNRWDYEVCNAVDAIYAPRYSHIEHIGRFGGGVNGVSEDKALNFTGYIT